MRHAALAAVLLCGCTALPQGANRPPEPDELRAVDATVTEWRAAGFPVTDAVATRLHKIAIVPRATDAQVAQMCNVPACGGAQPPLPILGCAWACTVYLDEQWPFDVGTPVIVISEHVQNADRSVGEPVIHETLHVLAPALLGHDDRMHRDARLWRALHDPACVQTRARERFDPSTRP